MPHPRYLHPPLTEKGLYFRFRDPENRTRARKLTLVICTPTKISFQGAKHREGAIIAPRAASDSTRRFLLFSLLSSHVRFSHPIALD